MKISSNLVEIFQIFNDYNFNNFEFDPSIIRDTIDIPVQGGLDPKILLQNKEIVRNEVTKYLKTFDKKRYIFNLGHGILPETNPDMVRYLVDEVRSFNGQ